MDSGSKTVKYCISYLQVENSQYRNCIYKFKYTFTEFYIKVLIIGELIYSI